MKAFSVVDRITSAVRWLAGILAALSGGDISEETALLKLQIQESLYGPWR